VIVDSVPKVLSMNHEAAENIVDKLPDQRDTRGTRPLHKNRRGEARTPHTGSSDSGRAGKVRPLIPLLLFGAFAVFIASQEIPAVADWLERMFQPAQWQAKVSCRDAVLADMPAGSYPRLQDGGSLHQTRDGSSVIGIRFTKLGHDGEEQVVTYDCYLTADGQLHRLAPRKP